MMKSTENSCICLGAGHHGQCVSFPMICRRLAAEIERAADLEHRLAESDAEKQRLEKTLEVKWREYLIFRGDAASDGTRSLFCHRTNDWPICFFCFPHRVRYKTQSYVS